MKTFTIDQIAHFDRCLFPEDFMEALIKHGIDSIDASMVAQYIIFERRKGNNVGIVNIYQEYISWLELHTAIDNILKEFTGR